MPVLAESQLVAVETKRLLLLTISLTMTFVFTVFICQLQPQ